MRKAVLHILLLFALAVSAETNAIKQFLADITAMGGQVSIQEEYGEQYIRAQIADSATIEVFNCPDTLCDKWFVIMTVCAPQCSSSARVYNKIGEYLFPLEPTVTSIFPLATIDKETGKITWTDNDTWSYQSTL